jgi:hypothetical protein
MLGHIRRSIGVEHGTAKTPIAKGHSVGERTSKQ